MVHKKIAPQLSSIKTKTYRHKNCFTLMSMLSPYKNGNLGTMNTMKRMKKRTSKSRGKGAVTKTPGEALKAKIGTGMCRWTGSLFQPLEISDRGPKSRNFKKILTIEKI